jgi:glycosyltransferase involved in cell wall biosynthesis
LTATRTITILSVQPVAERGGSDQALLRLVRSLPRAEFDFHIALPGPSPLAAEFRDAGATLHVVRMPRLSTSHGAAEWAGYVANWPPAVARLTRLARRLHVDVVHSNSLHTWYGWAAARLLGRPHVVHAREIVVQSRAALRVERGLCRHFATRVVAVSYAVAAQLDPANVVVLDEYLDPDEFSPNRAGNFRRRVDIPDDVALVGAVARLDPLKGLDVLLDAYAIARAGRPELRLVIVGGPVLGQDAYAAALAARVAATPGAQLFEARDDVAEVMADLDVLAFPSIEPESYGLVLVEALASGTAAVATDHGGPPEIVARATPGRARVVPPGDAGALAAALVALLPDRTSPERRRARLPAFIPPEPNYAGLFRSLAPSPAERRERAGAVAPAGTDRAEASDGDESAPLARA